MEGDARIAFKRLLIENKQYRLPTIRYPVRLRYPSLSQPALSSHSRSDWKRRDLMALGCRKHPVKHGVALHLRPTSVHLFGQSNDCKIGTRELMRDNECSVETRASSMELTGCNV